MPLVSFLTENFRSGRLAEAPCKLRAFGGVSPGALVARSCRTTSSCAGIEVTHRTLLHAWHRPARPLPSLLHRRLANNQTNKQTNKQTKQTKQINKTDKHNNQPNQQTKTTQNTKLKILSSERESRDGPAECAQRLNPPRGFAPPGVLTSPHRRRA